MTLSRVLVANRGEIARRVFATCRSRGIDTVAVFSDADADSAFVAEADAAVRLPGTTPAETYLRGDLIIDAALATGADAVHPGYGFLSENADFARSVAEAGLTWIGPSPESIESMGSKIESKRLMAEAGVPVLTELAPEEITEADLPVLVKASAGGGGRGMRVVDDLAQLPEIVAAASREAASAFGDPTVFCERYIPTGHHIEVQIFGDRHGTVWAVGDRECSLQRRHQKVVEEAPAPLVDRIGADMRERLHTAARSAAARIGYVGAGTVEFLAADDGSFYFLEMNTRLQVEHPVTECTVGLDLVGLQLDIAAGEVLTGAEPVTSGHAIEVRLYAEDPGEGWAPQSGPVHAFDLPAALRFTVPEDRRALVRLDAGLEAGEVVSTHYDPMIAKIIGIGPDRESAARVLRRALTRMVWDGPRTNAGLLAEVLAEPVFLTGETSTQYFDEHPEVFAAAPEDVPAVVAAALATAAAVADGAAVGPGDEVATAPLTGDDALALATAAANPRPRLGGWRLFHPDWRTRTFADGQGRERTVGYRQRRTGWELDPASLPEDLDLTVSWVRGECVCLRIGGVERRYRVERTGERVSVTSAERATTLREMPRYTDPSAEVAPGSLLAPMPGTVIRIGAEVGARIEAGTPLLWVEAMKMEHVIRSDADGVLAELRVAVGDQVDVGMMLAVIAAEDEEEGADGRGGAGAASVTAGGDGGAGAGTVAEESAVAKGER